MIKLDHIPEKWEARLSLYLAYLIKIRQVQSGTVRSYVSAIKSTLIKDGYPWNDNDVLLNSITKSCKLKNDRVRNRLPIRRGLLEIILDKLEQLYDKQVYLQKLYKAAFCIAYYGLLRVGEVADSPHTIKATNVHSCKAKGKLLIQLITSKTHGLESRPQEIIISKKSMLNKARRFCPVDIINAYIKIRRPAYNVMEYLFIFRDGSPLKKSNFRQVLKRTLHSLNLDETLYDTHSFRIGRATDLLKAGMEVEEIKIVGRWKSNAVYNYLRGLY